MSARALRLDLAPSASLAGAIVGAHAAAGACAALVVPGFAGALLGGALAALGLASAWARALHRSRASVRAIEIEGERLTIFLRGGAALAVQAAQPRYVGRLMVAVPVRGAARRTLLITADMLPAELFRALRVWALWGRLPPVAGKPLAA